MLKLSGEVFLGKDRSIDFSKVKIVAEQIAEIRKLGAEIAIVIGGGNIWRYRDFVDLICVF